MSNISFSLTMYFTFYARHVNFFLQVLTAAAVLFYPGLILIDHGHFQYPLVFNTESLSTVEISTSCFTFDIYM